MHEIYKYGNVYVGSHATGLKIITLVVVFFVPGIKQMAIIIYIHIMISRGSIR